MGEVWKCIIGYEDLYEISNYGNVRSLDKCFLDKEGKVYRREGVHLKPARNKYGYLQVSLSTSNKQSSHTIHTLVTRMFIDNPENKPTVNHKDGDKLNNHYSNLEWATKSEQAIHSLKLKLRKMPNSWNGKFGGEHGASKKVNQYDKNGNFIRQFNSIIEASESVNIHPSGITKVCKMIKNTAAGYKWKYNEE